MTTRKIIDAKHNGEKVWLKGHAQAIYMSDGSTVEDAINNIEYSSIKNVPISEDENGELNISNENGNIGMKVSSEAVYAKDFVASEHKLSEKVNKDYVDNSIAELVDGAPETLNTLNEISAALKNNADIVDVLNQSISSKQDELVSGTNIKTINGTSILGSGNIEVSGEGNQVQSDWNETDTTSAAYIKNQPNLTIRLLNIHGYSGSFLAPVVESEGYISGISGDGYDGVLISTSGLTFLPEFLDPSGTGIWKIHNTGDGTKFLSDDGTYKEISGSGGSSTGNAAYPFIIITGVDIDCQISPNTFYLMGGQLSINSLSITLGDEIDGVANEYIFQFTTSSEPTTFILPDSIKFNSDFTVEANKIYQISILNGLGTVMSWDI